MKFLINLSAVSSLLCLGLLQAVPAVSGTPTADEILKKVDEMKIPKKSYRSQLVFKEYRNGKLKLSSTMVGKRKYVNGLTEYLVIYLSPPQDAGSTVQVFPKRLWMYFAATKATMRVSAQQRLMGHVSVADVMNQYYSIDYSGKLVDEPEIEDVDHKKVKTYHLDVKGITDNAGYVRGELWVTRDSFQVVKAKWYSETDRLLKTMYLHQYQPALGAVLPMEAIIIDALDIKAITTVQWSDYRYCNVQDKWFQKEFLPYLKPEDC